MQIHSRVDALKKQLDRAREHLVECTSVRTYDNTRAQIAFIRDLLARVYRVEV